MVKALKMKVQTARPKATVPGSPVNIVIRALCRASQTHGPHQGLSGNPRETQTQYPQWLSLALTPYSFIDAVAIEIFCTGRFPQLHSFLSILSLPCFFESIYFL